MNEIQLGQLTFEPFITQEKIQEAIKTLAAQLTDRYRNSNPIFIVVLNGAFIFAADLLREMDMDCETNFVKIKSYDGLQSTGKIEVLGMDLLIEGREVVIVEDIIDTGNTLSEFIPMLKEAKPQSVKIVSLLFKKSAFKYDYRIDYYGISIPDDFVIGYGLDYNGKGRTLKSIYRLKKSEI